MLNICRCGVLFGELQQLFFSFGETGDYEGFGTFAGRDMYAATHAHDRVESCSYSTTECTVALNDFCMTQASASSEEFKA